MQHSKSALLEAARRRRRRRTGNVLEVVVADHVDDGAHDRLAVASDLVEQRLEPSLRRLAVRVQEREHAARRCARALETRPDQTRALLQAEHLYGRRQRGHVLFERRAQMYYAVHTHTHIHTAIGYVMSRASAQECSIRLKTAKSTRICQDDEPRIRKLELLHESIR